MDASLAAKIQPMSIDELQIFLKQLGFMDSVTSKLVGNIFSISFSIIIYLT